MGKEERQVSPERGRRRKEESADASTVSLRAEEGRIFRRRDGEQRCDRDKKRTE